MIRDILKMGDPRLLEVARPVKEIGASDLKVLLADMHDTMAHHDGAGLAAPQIGVGLRVVIFGVKNNPRYPEAEEVPYTVLINPVLEMLSDTMEEAWEGCLSVPGLRGMVSRHVRLRYHGLNESGRSIERVAEGFHARVVQHECDHLDGILYPMRVRDFKRFGFIDALFPNQDIRDE